MIDFIIFHFSLFWTHIFCKHEKLQLTDLINTYIGMAFNPSYRHHPSLKESIDVTFIENIVQLFLFLYRGQTNKHLFVPIYKTIYINIIDYR